MSTSTASKTNAQSTGSSNNTLPSCVLCKKRKVKCDRSDPCSNCQRSGAECVFPARTRLPRGRQGGRRKGDSELLKRISKLENLVHTLEGNPASTAPRTSGTASWQDGFLTQEPTESESQKSGTPLSDQTSKSKSETERFQTQTRGLSLNTITDEINGLRYVLGGDYSEDEGDSSIDDQNPDAPSSESINQSRFVIGGPSAFAADSDVLREPSRPRMLALLEIYMKNVHPVSKTLHGPSLRKYFEGSSETLQCSAGPGGLQALRFAIYHASTTSLDEQECLQQLGEDKTTLLARFRSGTQVALAKADFVNTVELSTLQALLLFLFSIRAYDNSRYSWTLFGICLRIAHALGLNREGHNTRLPLFQAEMRRRIWWQLCLLDSSLAVDRGTDPAISQAVYNTRMPLHINDADIWPGGPDNVHEREEFTDMTFCLLVYDTYETIKAMNFIPPSERDSPQTQQPDDFWERRHQTVIACQQRLEQKYTRHCDVNQRSHWATLMVADNILATLWLTIYRPLQQTPSSSPHSQKPNILYLAIEVMEKYQVMASHPAAKSIRWLSASYVQWHPLAITLAELCVQTDGPIVQRAWNCVNSVFESIAEHVADSSKGMLWRPIKKLMAKAEKRRLQNSQPCADEVVPTMNLVGLTAPAPAFLPNDLAPAPPQGLNALSPSIMEGILQPTPNQQQQQWPLPTTVQEGMIDWDPWLIQDTKNQMANTDAMNQDAWANWENFVTEFQGEGEFTPEMGFGAF